MIFYIESETSTELQSLHLNKQSRKVPHILWRNHQHENVYFYDNNSEDNNNNNDVMVVESKFNMRTPFDQSYVHLLLVLKGYLCTFRLKIAYQLLPFARGLYQRGFIITNVRTSLDCPIPARVTASRAVHLGHYSSNTRWRVSH